jgi:hypothetical protein
MFEACLVDIKFITQVPKNYYVFESQLTHLREKLVCLNLVNIATLVEISSDKAVRFACKEQLTTFITKILTRAEFFARIKHTSLSRQSVKRDSIKRCDIGLVCTAFYL